MSMVEFFKKQSVVVATWLILLNLSFVFCRFTPILGYFYLNFDVYKQNGNIILGAIFSFAIIFLVLAVKVFKIHNIKHILLVFLSFQPIKLIVDITARFYGDHYYDQHIFSHLNIILMFMWLSVAKTVIENAHSKEKPYKNLGNTLKKTLPCLGISVGICACEAVFMFFYQVAALVSETLLSLGFYISVLFNFALCVIWGLLAVKRDSDSANPPTRIIIFYDMILLFLVVSIPTTWYLIK